MKFNGNITLNALGQSEVQNFVAERVAANPSFNAAEAGRLIYNTTTRLYYMNSGLAWVALATGGDASALQTEVDAVESAIGTAVSASGAFNAAAFTGSNIVSATSITDAINQLDAAASGKDALAELVDVALTAPSAGQFLRFNGSSWVNDTMVLANVTDVTATFTEVNQLVGVTSNVQAQLDAAGTATGDVAADLAAETTARTTADAALQAELDAEEAARIASDAAQQAAITAEETRAIAAEAAIDGRVTTEVNLLVAEDARLAGLISDEHDHHTAENLAVVADLDAEISARSAADLALELKLEQAIAGLTWENAVDSIEATLPGTPGVEGSRVYVEADNKIYTVVAGVYDGGELLVEGAAFFDKATDVPYVFNGTVLTQFNGASGITAGLGLVKTGNTLDIVSTSGTITVTADSIDVSNATLQSISDAAAAVVTERNRAELAESGLNTLITDEVAARLAADIAETAARTAAIQVETDARLAADTAMQAEIDAEEARALAAEGVLTTDLAAEVTRATAAELVLTDAIADEEARALAAEAAIVANVAKGYFLYDGVAATTHTVTHGIGSRFCNVTVIDSATNEQIIPQAVIFDTATELTVTFNVALACKVVVMGLGV